mmetsp:Transcript_23008/g.57773  ORF Transcript_23008/g.57773 Transcript_23008/m.57773 type:complete len:231 (+) Transcript_23008:756-1448(+)
MSFWKQDPPKPTLAFRNFEPMRLSVPRARLTCWTSAPVASHRAEMEFTLEIRCARKALATSLESSEDHRLVVRICSRGTQLAYTSTRAAIALRPLSVSSRPPISTRSGASRSGTAVPSARNSGLDRMSKVTPGWTQLRLSTFSMACAVFTGTVDFSTTILLLVDTAAIMRAALSQYVRSAAKPAPTPRVFVGVFTLTKMMSASATCFSTSLLKKRLRPRARSTTCLRPGS